MKPSQIVANIENILSAIISEIFEVHDLTGITLAVPTDRTKADLVCNIAFQVAGRVKKSPLECAETMVARLIEKEDVTKYFTVSAMAPGFINFKAENGFLAQVLNEVLENEAEYGKNEVLTGQTWVVEHTSPNPNKAMHFGHLRNNLVGMAIARALEFSGAHVICDMIDNNRGIAIAKAMWGFLKAKRRDGATDKVLTDWVKEPSAWLTPSEVKIKADHFVGECYLVGADAYKSDEAIAKEINQMVVDWEAEDENTWALWNLVISYAHQGIDETLLQLGNRWDHQWHEHEHYKQGKDLVTAGLEKGIFKKLPDGAVLSNLEQYKLPDTILIKSSGTSLYITQDLALTKLKKEKYQAHKLIWVVGPEQGMALKQVFAICEQLGIGKISDFIHVPYGLVKILDESGRKKKMSSRGGEAVYIDDLIASVTEELMASGRGYTREIAQKIGVSAIKFAILKIGRNSEVAIDLEKVISLEGDSGVYILYTYGRMNSLLEKAGSGSLSSPEFTVAETDLLMQLYYFPHWAKSVIREFSPNLIAEYLLKLAQSFNSFYAEERIISEDEKETAKKLALTKALSIVYQSGLELLGMDLIKKI